VYWIRNGCGANVQLGPLRNVDASHSEMVFIAEKAVHCLHISRDSQACFLETTMIHQEQDEEAVCLQGQWSAAISGVTEVRTQISEVMLERTGCFRSHIVDRLGSGTQGNAVQFVFQTPHPNSYITSHVLDISLDDWTGIISILWWSGVDEDDDDHRDHRVRCYVTLIHLDDLARHTYREGIAQLTSAPVLSDARLIGLKTEPEVEEAIVVP
jgi:hypothetical protein